MRRAFIGATAASGTFFSLVGDENVLRRDAAFAVETVYRTSRVLSTAAVVGADYFLAIKPHKSDRNSPEAKAALLNAHRRSGARLASCFESVGGIFVKAGQYLASANHVLPAEFLEPLRRLQDANRAQPWQSVRRILRQELGSPWAVFFATIDPVPIGAASIAQVHRAVTHDGREVAVKVQHDRIAEQVRGDVATIRFIFSAIPWFFPAFQFSWMLPDFRRTLAEELNFLLEAQHADQAAAAFRGDAHVLVPAVQWDLTAKRVVCSEFVHAAKLTDLPAVRQLGVSLPHLAATVARAFGDMTCSHAFVHSDPHPGNLLVRRIPGTDKGQLIVLDHGMYRELPEAFREQYCRMWSCLVRSDRAGLVQVAHALGVGEFADLLSAMFTFRTLGASEPVGQRERREEMRKKFGKMTFEDVNGFLQRVPRDLLYTLRCNNLVRSVNKDLGGTSASRFREMARSASRGLFRVAPGAPISDQARVATYRLLAEMREDAGVEDDPAAGAETQYSVVPTWRMPTEQQFPTLRQRADYALDVGLSGIEAWALSWVNLAHGEGRKDWG